MSRVPIRIRLAALVALAMMLVLAGVGVFVYLRVAEDLDDVIDATLEARIAAVAASGRAAAGAPGDDEDGLAQVLAWNPMGWFVGTIRDAVLAGRVDPSVRGAAVAAVTIALLWLSLRFFRRLSGHFEDFL